MLASLRSIWIVVTVLTCTLIFFNLSYAVVPDTINYQGYLTNNSDEPVNATVSITFKIYSVDTGGIELWLQTQSVDIKNGKFSIELGDGIDPFPPDLFDGPLYLGIAVGSDSEMTPRKPLTSAPFAISAGDARTLEGETLTNIIYEDADAVIAMGAKFPTNPLNHDRYTDIEAVAAMGAAASTNPLHHYRYGNSEAVMAIKAADGAGSGLDADLLDGQDAADIISAASGDVRTPISSVPYTISTPGSYYFTGNLRHVNASTDAIIATANNVTINMMGFSLIGTGSGIGSGISMNGRTNVTIVNGTVRDFGGRGILEISPTGSSHRIVDVRAIANGDVGIGLAGTNHQIRGCTAEGNRDYGIATFNGSILINNTAYNTIGAGIAGGNGSTLISNTAYENASTGIGGGNGSTLSNNTSFQNSAPGIFGGIGSTILNNTSYDNSVGILGSDGSVLSSNSTYGNAAYGIYGGNGSSITNNTAYSNEDFGIYGETGSAIIGNTVRGNAGWGIFGEESNLIEKNIVTSNNASNSASSGGIRVGDDSRVVGNAVDSSYSAGIVMDGTDSIADGNHVTDSTFGIKFISSGNAYRNNTVAGPTAAYDGTATDLGGNVSY